MTKPLFDETAQKAEPETSKMINKLKIKVQDGYKNKSYILIRNGEVSYLSGNETPLALSNIAGNNAVELRDALEDAKTKDDVTTACRTFLYGYITFEVC